MSAAEDFMEYLTTQGIAGIWINHIPVETANSICIFDTGGYSSLKGYGNTENVDRPTIQIRIRGSSQEETIQRAEQIYNLLDGKSAITVGDYQYLYVECNGPPAYMATTQTGKVGRLVEFSMNLHALRKAN